MDLTALSAAELETLRNDVAVEQERRADLESIPALIEELSARYLRSTGRAQPPVDAATRGVGRPV